MDQSTFRRQEYASFLIRIWHEKGPDVPAPDEMHGEVKHIQTGQSLMFNSLEELWESIRQMMMTAIVRSG